MAVKKKIAGTAKRKPVKRKVSGVPKKRVSGVKKTIGRVDKGLNIIGKIGSMEKKYKSAKGKLKKDLLALEINSLHDELDKLKKQYKKAR